MLASVLLLILLILGMWPLALLCFLYTAYPLLRRIPKISLRYSFSILMLLLFTVSAFYGGRVSSILFLALAVVPFATYVAGREVVEEKDSFLVRGRFVPLTWYGVAKVKFSSQRYAECTSLMPDVSFFVIWRGSLYAFFSCFSFGRKAAEKKILDKMENALDTVIRRGAYLFPLCPSSFSEILRSRHIREKSKGYMIGDVISFKKSGNTVTYISFYKRSEGPMMVPYPKVGTTQPVQEVLASLEDPGMPDGELSLLLATLAALRSGLLDSIKKEKVEGNKVNVRVLSSPSIEMDEKQFDAILSVYAGIKR